MEQLIRKADTMLLQEAGVTTRARCIMSNNKLSSHNLVTYEEVLIYGEYAGKE